MYKHRIAQFFTFVKTLISMEAYTAACYHNCNIATNIHILFDKSIIVCHINVLSEEYENFVPLLFMPLYTYQTKNKNGKASPQNLNGNDG